MPSHSQRPALALEWSRSLPRSSNVPTSSVRPRGARTYKPDGGLWRIDVNARISCYRLPRATDPGANSDFKAGGFTSGGVPEILILNGRPSHAQQIVKKGVQRPPRRPGAGSGSNAGTGSSARTGTGSRGTRAPPPTR